MTLVSAAAAATLAILAKFGYGAGMSVEQLLALRFILAAAAMSGLAVLSGQAAVKMGLRRIGTLVLVGAIGYGIQTFLFFMALRTVSASLTELILYVYPSLVVLGGWALYRKVVPKLQAGVLVGTFVGIALLLGVPALKVSSDLEMAVAAPVCNAAYLLVAERVVRDTPALVASAFVTAGCAAFWTALAVWHGQLFWPGSSRAWLVLAAFVIGPSMIAIPFLLSALSRIGASKVALISTSEPLITVALAFALLGERLGRVQVVGATIILGALVLLQALGRTTAPAGKHPRGPAPGS